MLDRRCGVILHIASIQHRLPLPSSLAIARPLFTAVITSSTAEPFPQPSALSHFPRCSFLTYQPRYPRRLLLENSERMPSAHARQHKSLRLYREDLSRLVRRSQEAAFALRATARRRREGLSESSPVRSAGLAFLKSSPSRTGRSTNAGNRISSHTHTGRTCLSASFPSTSYWATFVRSLRD
jgi:hypothetical protein